MKIYAIPGLGTTKDLYTNTKLKNHELIVLNWPQPLKHETLKEYAKKFISQINTNEPFGLLGVSFGGMLCVEISKLVKAEIIFLISTAKTPSEFPWFIRILKYVPLHLLISEHLHRKMAFYGRWFIGFDKQYKSEFLEMINSMPDQYFKRCINMIANWKNTSIPNNAYHIHGTNDRLIPHTSVNADVCIEKGTHAMIVFRSSEINEFINEQFEKINQSN